MAGSGLLNTSWSIRTKIVLGTGAVALISWLLLAAFSYAVTGLLLAASSRQMFDAASRSISAELRSIYEPVARTNTLLAVSRRMGAQDEATRLSLVPFLIEVLRQTPAAAAIQAGDDRGDYFIVRALNDALSRRFEAPPRSLYEADIIDGASHGFRRWFYDDAGRLIAARQLVPSDYDPRTRPWYRGAMEAPGAAVTPPYAFYFMKEIGVTVGHATPDRRAVVATDVTLASMSRVLAALRLTPSSAAVLRDADGIIAWSGDAPALVEQADGTLRRRAIEELDHPALTAIAKGTAPSGWLVHRTSLGIGDDASSELIVAVPQAELLADARRTRTRVLLVSFVVLGLLIPLTWVLANRISTPLRELHEAIGRVRGGDFDFWLPEIRGRDEVGDLNLALRTMRESLKQSVKELAAATAARERLQSELDIARRIQMGFVRGGGRLSGTFAGADLFGCLVPARAVGGDLYEMIELPDGRLFVAVADVSDKGIHAALLMSRVVTLAKLLVPSTNDLAALLHNLNSQLVEGNDESMFVTLFCAIVDARTGEAKYASAGHNPPLVVRKGAVTLLPVDSGPPLGLFDGAAYAESATLLQPRERLVMYTDGITEAFDEQGSQFGVERLVAVLEAIGSAGSVQDLGSTILREVSSFAGAAPQSDDITLLILDRMSASFPPMVMRLKGADITIGNALDPVNGFAERAGLPSELRNDVLVIVDEVLSNLLKYASPDRDKLEVEIQMSIEKGALVLRFVDSGAPFDPLSATASQPEIPVEKRQAGGLGIHLIKALTDSQRHTREDGRNVLVLTRSIAR
jgi:sigma-B regulation protein RsbU (phosphoserine phosphatase)